jgi:hypothetical protein
VTRRRAAAALRREDGTTLVEVLVTAALAVATLLAVLMIADLMVSQSAAGRDKTGGEEAARKGIATLVSDARDAPPATGTTTPFVVTAPHDLILAARPASGSGPAWVRYCVGGTDGSGTATSPGALRIGTLTGAFVDPGSSCPAAGTGGWTYTTVITGGVRNPGSLFTYDVQQAIAGGRYDATKVGAVTITLTVDAGQNRTTSLVSAVAPRNRS